MRPLKELEAAAEKISGGDFSVRLFLADNSEVINLSNSFNKMSEKLRGLVEELNRQKIGRAHV